MTKRYRITKKHSVYGNDLKILSSAIKYREKELLDYPIEAMGKEISIDTFPPHLKNTSRLLLSNYVDYFKQIYFIVAFINEHYKNKNCLIQNSGNWKVNVNDIHGYSSTQYALNE